ncbi:MAG TPA: ThiF family adenylyltransferase [Anaerolineae bacterium]|nr:ThiF family adenylyltransferase [Anaerolineae bacterium]
MSDLDRYARQSTLSEIGKEGQRRLLGSTVAIVGCGALGTHIADGLVRAGVGRVRIIDRDFVELSNLQRQALFDEGDVATGLPKAIAAAEKLRRINSQVQVEPVVADVNPDNVEALLGDVGLVLDGTDNFETRLLINDACVKHSIPWIYGGVIATHGMTMTILPHQTPCFRCLLGELPAPGTTPTCDTAGVLGPAATVIAALEVTEGLKLLTGQVDALRRELLYLDVWHGEVQQLTLGKCKTPCPACDLGQFEYLEAREGSWATSLCGRDAVQVNIRRDVRVSLAQLADRLASAGEVAFNDYMLRFRVDGYELNVFPDGRAIIVGCTDPAAARTLYAKYIGL